MDRDTAWRIEKLLLQELTSLARAGVGQLRKPPTTGPALSAPAIASTTPTVEEPAVAKKTAPSRGNDPAAQLAAIQNEVAACRRCRELAATRTQTVFGVGNQRTRLCFLGEAPGADEDRQGIPFVGRAGKLLTDMIEKGMGLPRAEVYILNVLKCRPPRTALPTPRRWRTAGNISNDSWRCCNPNSSVALEPWPRKPCSGPQLPWGECADGFMNTNKPR